MPLLLDAYNILHVVGVLPPDLAGVDLDELADLVAGSRFRNESAILVCDGPTRRHRAAHPSVHVRFAGPGRSADDLIIRLVGRSTAPRRVTVVTSDREIARAVRRRRATVIESDRFLRMLAEDHAVGDRERPRRGHGGHRHVVDRRQVDAWLRLFDLDPDLQAIPPSAAVPPRSPAPDPPTSTPTPPPGRPGRGRPAIDAERLADIDPDTVDELDTSTLLDGVMDPARDPDESDDPDGDQPRH